MTLGATNLVVRLGTREAVRGVSLAVRPGDLLAVIGPNGAGKSTLLRALCGVLPVAGGEVALDARPLPAWDRRTLARRIAYLPQERIVHWPLSVESVVALGRWPHKSRFAALGRDDRRAVEAAMETMDVAALAGRPATELSGGELARVLFARALAQEADILLVDEPTAGLDPAHALSLFAKLGDLATEGRSVVVATHDLSLAFRHATGALVMAGGGALAQGPRTAVFTADIIARAFNVSAKIGSFDGAQAVIPFQPRSD